MICSSLGSLKIEEGTIGSDRGGTSLGDGAKEIRGASHWPQGKDHRCEGKEQIGQGNHSE